MMFRNLEKSYRIAAWSATVLFLFPPMLFVTLLSFLDFENIFNYLILVPFFVNIASLVFQKKILERRRLSQATIVINCLSIIMSISFDIFTFISEGSFIPHITL